MKFSELLGEPEPESHRERERDLPEEAEPISVFAPVPVAAPPAHTPIAYPSNPPEPVTPRPAAPPVPPNPPVYAPPPEAAAPPRTGLAEVNIRQELPDPPADAEPHPLANLGLETVVDDLLPSTGRRGRK